MSSKTTFTIPVTSFRNLETPFSRQGYRNYFAVVKTEDLPDLAEWRKINVRDPKLTGAVPRAIRRSFIDNPDMFLFMNRGIIISADTVEFDTKTSTVTTTLSDPNLHGLLDGGHTYNIVLEETESRGKAQYIKVEFLEGFTPENITQIVDARNTSNQVREESLMNLANKFEPLKDAVRTQSYFSKIAWAEYEIDSDGFPKPIDVRELIAILTAFDRDNFDDKVHPINAYRSKAACLKHFKAHLESYEKLYPLVPEMCALYDHIYDKLPTLYNTVRGQTGDVSGGKFGKLTGCKKYESRRTADLLFIDAKSKYSVPTGFIFPILGAFRALLIEEGDRYVWGKGMKPSKLLDGDLGLKLADTIGNFALDAQNPSKTGKSPIVWQACYQTVEVHYLRAK